MDKNETEAIIEEVDVPGKRIKISGAWAVVSGKASDFLKNIKPGLATIGTINDKITFVKNKPNTPTCAQTRLPDRDVLITRQSCLKSVCALRQGSNKTIKEIKEESEALEQWILR